MRRAIEGAGLDVHVAFPATVERYRADLQRADLRPVVPRVLPGADEDEDPPVLEPLPVLPSVPIIWPRGGGYYLHLPLDAGDSVLVVVCEQDLSAWLRTGEANADPGNPRRHDLTGAVAIPCLAPRSRAIAPGEAQVSAARLAREGGPALAVTLQHVECGGTERLVRWNQLNQHLAAISMSIQQLAAAIPAGPQPYDTAGRDTLLTSQPPQTGITRGV